MAVCGWKITKKHQEWGGVRIQARHNSILAEGRPGWLDITWLMMGDEEPNQVSIRYQPSDIEGRGFWLNWLHRILAKTGLLKICPQTGPGWKRARGAWLEFDQGENFCHHLLRGHFTVKLRVLNQRRWKVTRIWDHWSRFGLWDQVKLHHDAMTNNSQTWAE